MQQATFHISIFKHSSKAFGINIYIWCCFLCIQGSRDYIGNQGTKEPLTNLQFSPESLGATLDYWYIECGLFTHSVQHSQKQPATGSTNHLFWRIDRFLPVRNYIMIMMKLLEFHQRGCKNFRNYMESFSGKMQQQFTKLMITAQLSNMANNRETTSTKVLPTI